LASEQSLDEERKMERENNAENAMIRDAVQGWAKKNCSREVARRWDEEDAVPGSALAELAALGLCEILVPEAYGGQGRNVKGACIVTEELAYASPALAALYAGSAIYGGEIFSAWGSDEQKKRFLPACAAGECMVAPVMDNPDAGAGNCVVGPEAVKKNKGFLISGETAAVPVACQADLFLVLARTGEGHLTMFCIRSGEEGIGVTPTECLGYHGSAIGRIRLDSFKVSDEDILGGAEAFGNGWELRSCVLGLLALQAAAQGVGIARAAFDYALEHAKQRIQFSQPIGRFMAIRHLFSRNFYMIEAARLMVGKAAWLADHGESFVLEAAMAKCLAQETARSASLDGLQVLGGYGYTMEYDAQRHVRDAAGLNFIGGTSDGLKGRIGDLLQLS